MFHLDPVFVLAAFPLILRVEVVIVSHHISLCNDLDLKVLFILFLLLPLQLESSQVVLVILIILQLFVLAQAILTHYVLSDVLFLFDGLNLRNRHVNFLINDYMELFLFFGNIASQEDV